MSSILFIGLGNMGAPMAHNLITAGYSVYVYDIAGSAIPPLVEIGAVAVENLQGFDAGDIETVLSMLPAGSNVQSLYCSADGLPKSLKPGTLCIDCSTIDIDVARKVGAGAEHRGYPFLDAPVSGGTAAAKAGTLTFMVGGSEDAFMRAKPLFEVMGRNVFHAGALGNGQVAKICNNMLLGIHMIGTCEAFHLAKELGLDAQTFFDISSTASGQNWSMTSYCPAPGPVPQAPSNKGYQPGFTAAMMLKDLRLAQTAAQTAKAATPLGAQAAAIYALLESMGKDSMDFSGIMKLIDGSL